LAVVVKDARERSRAGRGRVLAGLLAVGLAGCRDGSEFGPVVPVYEVRGKVMLAGKKPLTSGRVYFVPTQEPFLTPSGAVGPDGTFRLTTARSGEGAPPGSYKVRVEPEGAAPYVKKGAFYGPRNLPYPFRYLDEDSSGLTASVKPGPNELAPFVLK
jgi:hypothetical protein